MHYDSTPYLGACSPYILGTMTPMLHVEKIIIIIIVPRALPPHDTNLLNLLIFSHSLEQSLQLLLRDLLSQLSTFGEHNKSVLDVFGAGGLDEADTAEAFLCGWFEDLVKDGLALFRGCCSGEVVLLMGAQEGEKRSVKVGCALSVFW